MASWIGTAVQALAMRHRQWRRARNLRRAPLASWFAMGGMLAALFGAAVIAVHARQLGQAGAGLATSVDALQDAIPGAVFSVPSGSAITLAAHGDAAIVVAAGMRAGTPVRVDLCSQMLDKSHPLRIGYQFADVARLVAVSRQLALRNVALAGPNSGPTPRVQVSGVAASDFGAVDGTALKVAWTDAGTRARWASDAGPGAFRRDAWLVWQDAALHLQRRASATCPGAGELLVALYRKGDGAAGRALVTAFPAHGQALSAWLVPGQYSVPQTPRASLEDQSLFQDLYAHGLVRLGKDGLIELAPRDLAAWQLAPASARAGLLAGWDAVARDAATLKLFKRLYRMADGDYVREQVRIFNNERRLLAWRVRPAQAQFAWQASSGAAPLATRPDLPLAAARLFAEVPQGWAPWTRVAAWPDSGARATARIGMAPASGGERIELMLIGRVLAVHGARLVGTPRDACSGRACPSDSAVQLVQLEALPGARRIEIEAAPFEMTALDGAGEDRYRHLRVAGGQLEWRALAAGSASGAAAEPAGVTLEDRHGALLWSGGAPSPAALAAGLAPLLGLRAGHPKAS